MRETSPTSTTESAESLLSIKQEAELLNVPISWLYGETRKKGPNSIPHIRVGKYVRFQHGCVLEWLQAKGR
ncbi:MAG: helix-turn-helix domain-containing protein [Syntrophobacteraceae bacterium]